MTTDVDQLAAASAAIAARAAARATRQRRLLAHLCEQRAHLIDKMSDAHQVGGDVAAWLPLLAQTQAAIEAVEAAMRESLTP